MIVWTGRRFEVDETTLSDFSISFPELDIALALEECAKWVLDNRVEVKCAASFAAKWLKNSDARRQKAVKEERRTEEADHRCAWVADGVRCAYPGSITTSTHGGGPWYCRAHDACHDGAAGAMIVELSRQSMGGAPDYSLAARRAAAEAATRSRIPAWLNDMPREDHLIYIRRWLLRIQERYADRPMHAQAADLSHGLSTLPADADPGRAAQERTAGVDGAVGADGGYQRAGSRDPAIVD